MKRKGQAALEFLMTYGWAILAAIVVIALLAIYVNPGSFRPDATLIEPPFTAAEGQVSVASNFSLVLPNSVGVQINITTVGVEATSPSTVICPDVTYGLNVAAGGSATVVSDCTGLVEGDSFSANIVVNYIKQGATFPEKASGSITYEVIA